MTTKSVSAPPSKSWLKALSSPLFILPLFAILGLVGILNHHMWRDEMNTWLIVRDSASLAEMLGYVNYQGHPALWALLVALASTIVESPVIMQLLHWGLGTGAVAILWFYSHFPRWQKVLITFGYLPFFEYLLISRPYVLGMLFIFLFCALYPTRDRTYLGLATVLGLMANSHAFAALVSLAGSLTLGLELLLDRAQRSRYFAQAKKYDWLLSLVVLAALYLFAYAILNPPVDSANLGGREGWYFVFEFRKILKVLSRLLAGYTLIVPASQWFDLASCAVVGVLLFAATAVQLRRHRTPLLFYLLANGGLLIFFYLRFMGSGARHYGYLYLVLIAALWLAQYPPADPAVPDRPFSAQRSPVFQRGYRIIFTLILLFQLGGGLYRYVADLSLPFSAARAAAEYIQAEQLKDEFIVASPDTNMAALSGYLGRQLYYPSLQGLGSFTIFQEGRRLDVDPPLILNQVHDLLPTVASCKVLLILNKSLDAEHPELAIAPLAEFERSWHRSERMYLYWVSDRSAPRQCQT